MFISSPNILVYNTQTIDLLLTKILSINIHLNTPHLINSARWKAEYRIYQPRIFTPPPRACIHFESRVCDMSTGPRYQCFTGEKHARAGLRFDYLWAVLLLSPAEAPQCRESRSARYRRSLGKSIDAFPKAESAKGVDWYARKIYFLRNCRFSLNYYLSSKFLGIQKVRNARIITKHFLT